MCLATWSVRRPGTWRTRSRTRECQRLKDARGDRVRPNGPLSRTPVTWVTAASRFGFCCSPDRRATAAPKSRRDREGPGHPWLLATVAPRRILATSTPRSGRTRRSQLRRRPIASGRSTARLSGSRARHGWTRRVRRRHALIPNERVVVARRRLIPNIDAASGRQARRLLDRRIADGQVLPHGVVAGQRKHDDAVRISDGRVGLDDVIAAHNPDAEVHRRTACVSVAARLVPPERVIVALDSYAATRGRCRTVPHGDVALDADRGRRRIDPNSGHAVGGRRDALHPSLHGREEENPVSLKPLHDTGASNADVAL